MTKLSQFISPFSDPRPPITALTFEPVGMALAVRQIMHVRAQLLVKRFHLPANLLELSAAIEFFFEHGFHVSKIELVELAASIAGEASLGKPEISIQQPTDRFRALVMAMRAAEHDLRVAGISMEGI